MSYDQLRDESDFNLYMERPTQSNFSADEGMEDIRKRVIDLLERVAAEGGIDRAAAVSHSDVIKPALTHWLGMKLDLMHRITISNASITRVDLREGAVPTVRVMNLVPGRRGC
jgi:broad specificity phosphatase PhoE